MFVLGNFLTALATVVNIALTVLYWLIFIRALVSWFSPDPYNALVQVLHRVTEPVLEPIRRVLPPMALDLSPLIAFFAIIFLKQFLVTTLLDLAARIQ